MKPHEKRDVQYLSITDAQAGQRIDNFLITYLKYVPKTRIYRLLRKGEVRVNKKRIEASYRLMADDVVRLPPLYVPEEAPAFKPTKEQLEEIRQSILYEDENLLILNKPSGLPVHGGTGLQGGVINILRALRPDESQLELGHRLDKDTSGCLIIAKKRQSLQIVHDLFREGAIKKQYLALLKGHLATPRTVQVALQKNQLQSGARIVRVDEDGKFAHTVLKPKQHFNVATLVDIEIATGRTHQIRVHSAHIGHPVACDDKYGDRAFNRLMHTKGLKRLFLHAASLVIPYAPGKTIRITAPLDPVLQDFLKKIR